MINKYAKYFWIAEINFRNSFAYIFDVISSSIFIALIIFIFINLWSIVYGGRELVFGLTLPMMIWYLVFTEAMVTSSGKLITEIGAEVKSGEVANYLNKPYNYVVYKYAKSIGSTIFSFILIFAISAIVALLLVGPIEINLIHIPFMIIATLLGLTLYFAMSAFLGILAFWIEDSQAIEFVYSKLLFTIGGMLAPLAIWPPVIEQISLFLPFSLVAFYPAKLFVKFSFDSFIWVIGFGVIWGIVLFLATALLFRFMSKKLSINGG
jgi:ABC-2 type transport system permease protein